jgi:multimeric flavodoxin WrbA/ribosomal protein S18 acetylase RimI-like enzyme
MEIQALESKDIQPVVDIWYEASLIAHSFISADYWEKHKETMAGIYLPESETYVATEGGKILGFLAMVGNHLAAIFVDHKMQGRGTGKALLNFIKKKRTTIQLKAYVKNTKTIDFYKSQGFKTVSEHLEAETGEYEYLMEWNAPCFPEAPDECSSWSACFVYAATMTAQPWVIPASARKQGDTHRFLNQVFTGRDYKLIDLLDFHIAPYSYLNHYPDTDEFFQVADELLRRQLIVFATPVYWYAMSGLMKTFFDRFTDLVTTNKHLGRQLNGKSTFLLAVGADGHLPDGFETPFRYTSSYLGMQYRASIYYSTKHPNTEAVLQKSIRDWHHQSNIAFIRYSNLVVQQTNEIWEYYNSMLKDW